MSAQPEAWLRGPIAGVDSLLMPAAHALVQAMEDVERAASHLPAELLWRPVGAAASIGFHLKHLAASTDRLMTYARGERLSDAQRAALADERNPGAPPADTAALLDALRTTVDAALGQLRATDPASLHDMRQVGRAAQSTVLGLLFHAGEHAQRHAGQIVTSVKALRDA